MLDRGRPQVQLLLWRVGTCGKAVRQDQAQVDPDVDGRGELGLTGKPLGKRAFDERLAERVGGRATPDAAAPS